MKNTKFKLNKFLVAVSLIACLGIVLIAYTNAQNSSLDQKPESTKVKIVLVDYSSKPLSNAPVMINEFPNYTDNEGIVAIYSIPTGPVKVSVEWKGSNYTWPQQTVTAQDNQQLLSYRLPFFDSYGISSSKLISFGILLTIILLIVAVIQWLLKKYRGARYNSNRDARTSHSISKRKLNKAAHNNVNSLSVSPQTSSSKNIPNPTSPAQVQKPVQPMTSINKTQSINQPPSINIPPKNNQVQQTTPPQAPNQQPKPSINRPSETIVRGERLPSGIEVHDLTE
ncbi:MAG: hypothetical protein MUF85_03415 [Patescibacteria group bacterium]|jgi:hypothetical protein|nr:hypothetical protein [Patescibacteria group bacterium]